MEVVYMVLGYLVVAAVCGMVGGIIPLVYYRYLIETIEVINVKYHDPEPFYLESTEVGDCIDIYCPESFSYKAGETVFVDFKVAMELPTGFEAHVYPRSSTFKHTGLILSNSVGIIDSSYCGDSDTWKAMFYATRAGSVERGDRLVQFRIVKNQPQIQFLAVDSLGNTSRGGYGSTGK